jgi:hypothetical protein
LATDTSPVKQPSGCEVRILAGENPSVAALFPDQAFAIAKPLFRAEKDSGSGGFHGNVAARM